MLSCKNSEGLGSQSAEVLAKITEFAPQGLATTAWAYSSMGIRDSKLLDAISAEVLRKLTEIEPHSLGILADANLACREDVERTLRPLAEGFARQLPPSLSPEAVAALLRFVNDLRVDNFGAWGTRYIFSEMKFDAPSNDFYKRAKEAILESTGMKEEDGQGKEAANALSGSALVHRRAFSFGEYHIEMMSGGVPKLLSGSLAKENGRRDGSTDRAAATTWLKPISSPISGLVDRSLCSEFQLLSSVLAMIRQSPGFAVREGSVRLFVSTAPCVSCIWALWQFHLLLPAVRLEVANGEELYLLSTDAAIGYA